MTDAAKPVVVAVMVDQASLRTLKRLAEQKPAQPIAPGEPPPPEPEIPPPEGVIREMEADDPPFELVGGGTGWWAFTCGPLAPPEEAPSNDITGSVEAHTRPEAEEKISERFPGARFKSA